MKPKVYVETSMISYLAARSSHDPVTAGGQLITERWWSSGKSEYNLLISEAVEAECVRGDPEMVARRRLFLRDTALFPLNERILRLPRLLIAPGAVPEKAAPDAVHNAAAAVEKCEYLLTWNFRHIANASIRRQVPRKNSSDSMPWVDEVLRDLYESRDAYAEEHGNDLDRIFADPAEGEDQ